ncbi:MAG: HlyD family efflux transporter periplasmic adaptor subunit [Paludibacterium sp.]|uniref:efflux RND transporter periplasmic adaptor subunit n=1 Tax=Paludibacterium sp. TaxID=1917523 RepID=UPI0025D480DB|nr:HlyD family efflux transporter periplasmic adaptor subunit [Paludibacterium sp.]MBV8047587.1 HlyD family efflux transporter periplasmic adaptor subunit [Paludibacterium sp.]MBV8647577.1 HlyD family efflux transporter periplasmic adaptor subunit [Paludibacterium sp.]
MEADKNVALASLLQLLHRAREADNAAALSFVIVNESQQLLPYRQAALWREGLHRHVSALSGLAEVEPTAPYMQWLGAVFRWLAADASADASRMLIAEHLPARLSAEWGDWLPTHALWLRLSEQGALLLARETPWSDYERRLAEELAHGYAHALRSFSPRRDWRDLARQWLRPKPRQRRILLGVLLVALMPIRLSVLTRAEVVPREPLLLRAPIAGVIDHIAVEPNQRVAKGTPLFDLDATALSGQHALAESERVAAEERFRVSAQLALTDDKSRLAMAQDRAQLEEKAIAADYAGRELQRLHVTAPAAGVVVFSDRNDWQGRAVAQGEKVMTLADPARVELTAWLPAAEAIDLSAGGKVTLYPNASPLSSYAAEIVRVAYKAEPADEGLLAYRLQARFTGDAPPRLGQMGTARVYGNWVPLIYYVLRRPVTAARQWLGW